MLQNKYVAMVVGLMMIGLGIWIASQGLKRVG